MASPRQWTVALLTDLHFDAHYDPHATALDAAGERCRCHAYCANSTRLPLRFGQAGCDSPWALVNLSLAASSERPGPLHAT